MQHPTDDTGLDDAASGSGAETFAPDLHDIRHLRLKAFLLLVWVAYSFGASFFAREIQTLAPDWPLAYWLASQGAVLMFLAIVVVYCLSMAYFERREHARSKAAGQDAGGADSAAAHGTRNA